jgi:serine/threonine protein kinase
MPEDSLPLTVQLRIDALCQDFESAWNGGEQPQIEAYLGDTPEPERAPLFRALLEVELSLRQRNGSLPTPDDYRQRFPDQVPVIDGLFARTASVTGQPAATQPPTTPGRPSDGRLGSPGDEPIPGYQLTRYLGGGGAGEVWEAIGPGGFKVALKLVRLAEKLGATELQALDIIREIRHLNLLSVFGAWQTDGLLVIGMELADCTLMHRHQAAVKRSLPGIPVRELLRYSQEAAKVLDFLNKPRHYLAGNRRPVGIQHCDIKPQNILLIGSNVKVGDFGLVRVLKGCFRDHAGGMTPAYAPPEFWEGQISRWSDQYSLAVTYCHLRTGQLPFTGDADQLWDGHVNQAPDLTSLPESERPAVARALAKDPRKRWPNCRTFINALGKTPPPNGSGPRGDNGPPQPPTDPGNAPTEIMTESSAPEAAPPGPPSAGQPAAPIPGVRLLSRIARGAFGEVWRAEAPGGVEVAVKIIMTDVGTEWVDEELRAHQLIRSLRHPFLLSILDIHQQEDRMVVVMELADGSLRDRLRACQQEHRPGIPVDELLGHVREAAEAVDFLHSEHVMHRDINPGNLLLLHGHVKVAGVALAYSQSSTSSVTGSSPVAGTPSYMAPEVWHNQLHDHSDQYSLACTYAELRLGHPVYEARDIWTMMLHHLEATPDLTPLPAAEQAVLRRALAKNPGKRFRSCLEFVRALEQARHPRLEPAREMSATPRPRMAARKPVFGLLLDLLVLGVGLLLLGTTLAWWTRDGIGVEHTLPWWPVAGMGLAIFAILVVVAMVRQRKLLEAREDRIALGDEALPASLPGVDSAPSGAAVAGRLHRPSREAAPEQFALDEEDMPPAISDFGLPRRLEPDDRPETDTGEFALDNDDMQAEMASSAVSVYAPHHELVLEGHTDSVWAIAPFPDGRRILSGGADNTVRLWDVNWEDATHRERTRFEGHTDGVTCLAVSPDGHHVLSGSLDESIRLWDAASGQELHRFAGHPDGVSSVAYSADGRLFVSSGRDGELRIWDVESGKEVRRFTGHTDWVQSAAMSPDGRLILSGGRDKTLRLWEMATGQERRLEGHTDAVNGVAFSPDGLLAVSGSGGPTLDGSDNSVRLWDIVSGCEVRRWVGHTDWVRSVAFSLDGHRVLSGSDDETVRLWSSNRDEEVYRAEGHAWSVLSVAFLRNGLAISGSDDQTIRVWALPANVD